MAIHYKPAHDGTLHEYITRCNQNRTPPTFKGVQFFPQLVELGYIVPDISVVRIVLSHAAFDQAYAVQENMKLAGLDLPLHSGISGEHTLDELLRRLPKDVVWEFSPIRSPR